MLKPLVNCTWKCDCGRTGKEFCQHLYCPVIVDYINHKDLLRTFSPNKGKNMNVTPTTNTMDNLAITDVQHFHIDAEGNRIEIPFDVTTDSDGEAAQPVTAFIAEDGADHPVTVH